MSERLDTLQAARERMVSDRDEFAKVLAAPFNRDKAERSRIKFMEIQADRISRSADRRRASLIPCLSACM